MSTLCHLIKRNTKLFFKDKGMFFTSLITPAILLVLYVSFLGNVFRDSFLMNIPAGITVSDKIIDGLVGGQVISSILAVSCVTVSFCSNFLMVQDRANGTIKDLTISPVSPAKLSLGYYISTLISSLIVCVVAMVICLGYVVTIGWYMSLVDILALLLDIFLLVMFGTALSSVIAFFLTSQGQISAVGTIVSSGYGFICGAYMPIASFGDGLQKAISFLPGTYGTALVRQHAMRGALGALEAEGVDSDVIEAMRKGLDCDIYFFGNKVETFNMYIILSLAIVILLGLYLLMNAIKNKKR